MPDQPTAFHLAPADAIELREMLEFLNDWLDSCDRPDLSASLTKFTGGGSGAADLQVDLARFVFLLGGDDSGEDFFGPPAQR